MAKCPNCCKVYSVKYFKKYHSRICEKNSFVNKPTLANHMRSVHSNEKPFECEYCKMKFARSETLSKHRLRKHGQKKKGTMVENFFLSVYYQESHFFWDTLYLVRRITDTFYNGQELRGQEEIERSLARSKISVGQLFDDRKTMPLTK